jgi:hypothetical protein
LIIFMGVYLLNISRQPEAPHHATSLEAGLMSEYSATCLSISIASFADGGRPPDVNVRQIVNGL